MGLPPIALDIKPPAPSQGPMDQYQQAMSVQTLINQHALQKQQQQSNDIAQQQQQIQLQNEQQQQKDTQTFNKVFHDANGDWDTAIKNAPQAGVSGQYVIKAQLSRADQIAKMATANSDLLKNESSKADVLAKDAMAVRQVDDPVERQNLYAKLRNGHIASGAYKASELPENVPSDQELQSTIAHSKAAQDMMGEALKLQEQKAKLPGEAAESTAKGYSTAAQTMGGANEQLSWTARRNFAVKQNPDMAQLIPEQYSPEAAEQVRQLGIAPKDLATMAPDKLELQDWLKKHPGKGPADFMAYKATLVPAFNINMGGLAPGAGPASGNAPTVAPTTTPAGNTVQGFNYSSVPPQIKDNVRAILEYRSPMPPQSRNNPLNSATRAWVQKLDPNYEEADYGAKNKILTNYTSGAESKTINAINTAIGHAGTLDTAIQAMNNGDIKKLNAIGNILGIETGSEPVAAFKTIVHRLGPEITAAYVQGGGGQGERGTTEADFNENLAPGILHNNLATTVGLLRSKISADENQWDTTYKPRNDAEKFKNRFITPQAQSTLDRLAPEKGGGATAIPANVTKALVNTGPGRHKLSDGSVWDKHPDGTIVKSQ